MPASSRSMRSSISFLRTAAWRLRAKARVSLSPDFIEVLMVSLRRSLRVAIFLGSPDEETKTPVPSGRWNGRLIERNKKASARAARLLHRAFAGGGCLLLALHGRLFISLTLA